MVVAFLLSITSDVEVIYLSIPPAAPVFFIVILLLACAVVIVLSLGCVHAGGVRVCSVHVTRLAQPVHLPCQDNVVNRRKEEHNNNNHDRSIIVIIIILILIE